MTSHPNWRALSTVQFKWKSFVQASHELEVSNVPVEGPCLENYGEESRTAYEEVLSTVPQCTQISERINSSHSVKNVVKSTTSINISGTRLVNALMKEASSNNVDKLKILLEGNSDINVRDLFGWTMLMCASHAGAIDVVKYLLDKNACTSIKDKSGFTCISLAKRQKHYAILELFESQLKSSANKCPSSIPEITTIFCDVCKQHFEDSPSKPHRYSTVHLFNSHPRKCKTWYGIPDSNKGFKLMIKSGWNRDQGLGPHGSGTKVPCKTVFKTNRHGFGTKTNVPRVTHFKPYEVNAIESNIKIKKRDEQVPKQSMKSKISSEKRKERILRRELNF